MTEIKQHKFYGKVLSERHAEHQSRADTSSATYKTVLKEKRMRLLGPSEFWGEYSKQQEALEVAHKKSSSSMHTFVYQNDQGYRKFIVAHPEIYWTVDESRSPHQRCSYEVIPDGAPSHLYFDLEFPVDLNPLKNGCKMTSTLIDIVCVYFTEHWGFPCKRSEVLSLDSTTDAKFSRHLIFRVKNAMFKNNRHAGRFVKSICSNIKQSLFTDVNRLSADNVLKQFQKEDLDELFVNTSSGKKLFIDEGVYTSNRHFRIYKSTKWGKASHLTKSKDSEYIPSTRYKNEELGTFLDSLISYLPTSNNLILLEYQDNGLVDAIKYSRECLSQPIRSSPKYTESSYPGIDKFILDIVYPGKIRDVKYFGCQKLSYRIADYRYCANIGRPHKSNGIYWIVDLVEKLAFQKCYDFNCSGFKSAPRRLPDEICFQLDQETDVLLSTIPEPADCPQSNTDALLTLEDDSFDSALASIESASSMS